jgi:hypothetical protein
MPTANGVAPLDAHDVVVSTAPEQAFDDGDAEAAYTHCLAVIEEDPNHDLAVFARYKFAWVQYNLDDIEAARDDMASVGEWAAAGDQPLDALLLAELGKDLDRFQRELEAMQARLASGSSIRCTGSCNNQRGYTRSIPMSQRWHAAAPQRSPCRRAYTMAPYPPLDLPKHAL